MSGRRGGASRTWCAGVVMALALTGCNGWLQVGFGPEHQRHNVAERTLTLANVGTLTEQWSVRVPSAWQEPIVANGRVYLATEAAAGGAGALALDADDGATVWNRELWSGARKSPVALSGGLLYFSGFESFGSNSCQGHSGRLDPADGSDAGPVTDRLSSPPVTAGSVVVQTSFAFGVDGRCTPVPPLRLEVRDLATGAVRWHADISTPPTSWVEAVRYEHPTVADGHIYLNHEGVIFAFNLDGCGADTCAPIWSVDLDSRRTPVAGAGRVYVSTSFSETVALAGDDGRELWRADVYAPLAFADNTVFATTYTELLAYDAAGCDGATCSPLWTAQLTDQRNFSATAPAIAAGVVYVGVNDGLVAYRAAGCGAPTCPSVARVPLPGDAAEVTVADGKVFVTTSDPGSFDHSRITAFAPASGP